jgi:hypothetical protein
MVRKPTKRIGSPRSKMRDMGVKQPNVREMTLNGIKLTIVTRAGIDYYGLKDKDLIPIGGGKYIHGYLHRDDLYKASGYDMNKIDFAVPVPWWGSSKVRARYAKGDRAVWSYSGQSNRFSGGPIWDSEMMARLKRRINERLRR